MTDTLTKEDFWNRLDDVQAGMLAVDEARPVPMSHYADRDASALWFITAKETALVRFLGAAKGDARYIVASGDGQLYARIDGRAEVSQDRAKLEEIWNVVADAWFEDGKRDEDVALVRMDLSEAEVWATNGSLSFLFEIAKAQVTGEEPDMGAHGTLRFVA